jgi:hypothetical protein
MRRSILIEAILAGLLFGFAVSARAAELRVGAAAVVINPPLGVSMAGYYHARGATDVLDDLLAKAVVLEQEGMKAALVACDLITLPRHTVLAAREQIARRTGIPGENVMLWATHQHTGPSLVRESAKDKLDGATTDPVERYTAELPGLLARCVDEANRKLRPGRASAAIGREEKLSFNRRFWMKDGTVSWNPPKNDPNLIRPAGPIDPDVGVVFFESLDGKPLATCVNFAMHPDTTGGTRLSADYPGVLARRLADFRGENMVTLFANGCCGNINHLNVRWAAPQTSPAEAKRLGTILAGDVLRLCPELKPVAAGPLRTSRQTVLLPLAPITLKDIEKAREVNRRLNDPKTTFQEKVKAMQVLDVAARAGKPLEVEVQVIALGTQIAWVSLPGEIFVEIGLSIKAASPFPYTMIAELANGSVGYVPNKTAYVEGNYEVVSARCAEGSGEMLVAAAIQMLQELHGGK